MMTEISLNILDIAQNSVKAGASLIEITVIIDIPENKLKVEIRDNGCGMTQEQLHQVEDPFYTTRTTRKVGLGVPFFKYAALGTGGDFSIKSAIGSGTLVQATFTYSHIDRMPLGDINRTIHTLICFNTDIDFVYRYQYNHHSFTLDTREFKEILGDVALDEPEVSQYILEFLNENKTEIDGGESI